MAKKRTAKVRRRESQWFEILRRFEARGLGARAFRDRDGLPLSSFQRWRRRLGVGATGRGKFVELVAPAPASSAATDWSFELTLPNGASVRFQG